MEKRTDLALEMLPEEGLPEGVRVEQRGNVFGITHITIDTDDYRETTGKGRGQYITLESPSLSQFSREHEAMVAELAAELSPFLPEGDVLVAGLGNKDITPDAIGPRVAERVLATRHLSAELPEEEFLGSLRRVSVFAGGVMGQTGIETSRLLKAICDEIHPAALIAVDALACCDVSRLGTTIQITDTGISPGSGASNRRQEISREVFGIPVIALGVPTVVDMRTLTSGEMPEGTPNMLVTPKDIDRLTERASQLIAYGLNSALHPALSLSDVIGLF